MAQTQPKGAGAPTRNHSSTSSQPKLPSELTVHVSEDRARYYGNRAAIEAEGIPGIQWPAIGRTTKWTTGDIEFTLHRTLRLGSNSVTRRNVDCWRLEIALTEDLVLARAAKKAELAHYRKIWADSAFPGPEPEYLHLCNLVRRDECFQSMMAKILTTEVIRGARHG